MTETVTSLESKFAPFFQGFKEEILEVEDLRGDFCVVVKPGRIRDIIRFLKTEAKFEMMTDLFAMDYLKYEPEKRERYAVVYILYSFTENLHFRLKAYLPEKSPEIDSIHEVYAAANWNEREAWDLFGVVFKGHPHLVRILCHSDFVGHPLRKDYPSDQYQRLKNAAPSTGF